MAARSVSSQVRSAVHHVSARHTTEPSARRAGLCASACECPSFLAARSERVRGPSRAGPKRKGPGLRARSVVVCSVVVIPRWASRSSAWIISASAQSFIYVYSYFYVLFLFIIFTFISFSLRAELCRARVSGVREEGHRGDGACFNVGFNKYSTYISNNSSRHISINFLNISFESRWLARGACAARSIPPDRAPCRPREARAIRPPRGTGPSQS